MELLPRKQSVEYKIHSVPVVWLRKMTQFYSVVEVYMWPLLYKLRKKPKQILGGKD